MPVRLAVAALVLACAIAVPLRLSADVWAYAAYGALLTHGADPWSHAYRAGDIAEFADPLLTAALRAWDGSIPRDVYGPLFTAPVAALVWATRPFGPDGAILALRGLAAAALLGCIALAGRTRPRLATLLAFHPVVLWSAAEGHNDVFWLALVLLADRARGGPARLSALVAAAALKAVALVPLMAALATLPAHGRLAVASPRARLLAAAAALGVLALAYAPLARSVIEHGLDHGTAPPRISLLHAGALAAWSGSPVPVVVALLLAAAAAAAGVRALRGGDALAGAALLAWIALPAPEPWYALWLVPVVALAGRTPASAALLVASVTGVVGYVQDAGAETALRDPALLGGMMLALYAVPLLVALVQPAPSPAPNPTPPTPPAVTAPVSGPTPQPMPTSTTTPVPPSPAASPASGPSAGTNPFGYVVAPSPAGAPGTPRITEIALSDRVLHEGKLLLVRITTSPDVTTVVARTMGHEIAVPQSSPGLFAGQQQMPTGIPFFFLNRAYQVEFIATTADGRTTSFTMPIRLQR